MLLFSLVVPTYNEGENIGELIERVEAIRHNLPYDLLVLVVDDNSTDGTADAVSGLMKKYDNVRMMRRPRPSGLGSAYLDGFRYSIEELHASYVGEMDADLQHPPEALVSMCVESSEKRKDVVLASRYIRGGNADGLSFSRKIVSKGANALARLLLRIPVKDATTGYRVISSNAARGLLDYAVSAKGYAFQVESLYVYKKLGMSFTEVPFTFESRKSGSTKLNSKEIFRFFGTALRTGIFGVKRAPNMPLGGVKGDTPQAIGQAEAEKSPTVTY